MNRLRMARHRSALALVCLFVLLSLVVGVPLSSGQPGGTVSLAACVPPDSLPHVFQGREYRVVRIVVPVKGGAFVGQVLAQPCGNDARLPCNAVECVELLEPLRTPIVRLRGIRPSVAVAQRAPSPVLYVRPSLCGRAGRGANLVRCLVRASRTAPPFHFSRPGGRARADLGIAVDVSTTVPGWPMAIAHVANRGPAPAREVAVSFGFAGSVSIEDRSPACSSAIICFVGHLRVGETKTVYVTYYAPASPFAPFGATVTTSTVDPDLSNNRAYGAPRTGVG